MPEDVNVDKGITLNFDELDADSFQNGAEPVVIETGVEGSPDDTQLESQIQTILDKEEDALTDEEKELLIANEAIAEKLQAGEESEPGVLAEFRALEGFIEDGEYEDSLEGIQKYQSDRDSKRDPLIVGSFLKAHPTMAAFYKHVVVDGKSEDTFLKEVSKPEILNTQIKGISANATEDEKNDIIDQHIKVIKQDLTGKVPTSTLNALIKAAVENGETEQLAKDSLMNLNANYAKEIESIEEKNKLQAAQDKLDADNKLKVIKGLVSKGVLANNVTIPEVDKQGFIEFLTIPVDSITGQTKQEKVLESLSNEEDMVLDYLLYIKEKTGKLDASLLKTSSSVSKFFKNAKKLNDGRSPKIAKGSKVTYGNTKDLPNTFGGF